jgi:nucleoside-diphosphate-sugar epimerase
MHIIITGGCGYKGSVLVHQLLDAQHTVTVIDALWFGNYLTQHPNLRIVQQDIRTIETLPSADAIIHLAAVANDPSALLDPKLSWEVNVLATQHLLDLCIKHGIQRFIYASSGSVYGVKEEEHVTEDLSLVPISEYNKTKMVAERVVLSYKNQLNITIIRPATVCGMSSRMRLDVAVNALTFSALEKNIITVHGGNQIRPNVHILDIARAYQFCLDNPNVTKDRIFNVGFENYSLTDLALKIQKEMSLILDRVPAIEYRESNDPRSYRLNSNAFLLAGFRPLCNVQDAIRHMIVSYDENHLMNDPHWHNMKWMKQCNIK